MHDEGVRTGRISQQSVGGASARDGIIPEETPFQQQQQYQHEPRVSETQPEQRVGFLAGVSDSGDGGGPAEGQRPVSGRKPNMWGKVKDGMLSNMGAAAVAAGDKQTGKDGFANIVMAAKLQIRYEKMQKMQEHDPSKSKVQNAMESSLARRLMARRKQTNIEPDSPQKSPGRDSDEEDEAGDVSPSGDPDDLEELEELGRDHTRLLYLISLFSGSVPGEQGDSGEMDTWVRKVPLMVLIYEGIVGGIFDYDYAPAPDIVGGKRVYLNITQEGRDDLDDLREQGMLYGLKLSSKKYQSTVALRVTALGDQHLLDALKEEDKEAVEGVMYAPDVARSPENLLKVRWDAEELKFVMYSDAGYERDSTITEIESVSYVSSPYIPRNVRSWGRTCTSNADRTDLLKDAESNIKDELDENLTINNVHLLIGEWLPMGANQVVALNDKLGSSERVAGGFFTSVVDMEPDACIFVGESEGLTEVDILDFDETTYVNFEAEVHYPEEDGIVQVENFGVHINEEGFIMYGMKCEGIMHAIQDRLSLDNLSRLLVDVHVDSSKIVDNLLSPHQRIMLDLTYLNDAEHREKYNVILTSRINKEGEDEMLSADKYMDKEANENELKQVIGDTHASYDLSPGEVLLVGKNGLIVSSPTFERFEPLCVAYLSLMTRNMYMRSLFQRTFILADTLKHIRELIEDHESDPNSINTIRNLLSEASGDIILLSEIQSYLAESLTAVSMPEQPAADDRASRKLFRIFNVESTHKRLIRRVQDMKKNIDGSRGEVNSLRDMADTVSEAKEVRVAEAVQANTKNLEDVFRANERASASLEIMQVVLAGSLAFDIIDRLHGLYLGIAGEIDWAIEMFEPVYTTPGAYFIVNMAWWGILGGFIKYLLWHLGEQASGILSVRYRINAKISIKNFRRYLDTKSVEVENIDSDKTSEIKKFSWDETDTELWQGSPPKIEVQVDTKYAFLLSAFIQVATKKCKSTQEDVKRNFFNSLRTHHVITQIIPGIEDGVEIADVDEEEEEEDLEEAYLGGKDPHDSLDYVPAEAGPAAAAAVGETLVATRGRGELIGEMAVLSDSKSSSRRMASVRARTEVRALVVTKEEFKRILAEQPEAEEEIRRTIDRRKSETIINQVQQRLHNSKAGSSPPKPAS
mmetsp:Transcript_24580/g.80306  ORF Transcript_24580/g.80306 Transcript_24580/m.80306 type:complete len:1147 (-) Transcript_24580:43-3483(-)